MLSQKTESVIPARERLEQEDQGLRQSSRCSEMLSQKTNKQNQKSKNKSGLKARQ